MLCDSVTAPVELALLGLTSRTTPLLIRGLVPDPLEAAASALAAANGTEVRIDLSPLIAASSPFRLANGSLVRPAQVAHLPLGRVLELMRAPNRPYRAYVRYLGSEEAPALADALRLRPLGALLDAHQLRQHVRAFNVWLGDGSMRSGLHYDGFDNVLLQVRAAGARVYSRTVREGGCSRTVREGICSRNYGLGGCLFTCGVEREAEAPAPSPLIHLGRHHGSVGHHLDGRRCRSKRSSSLSTRRCGSSCTKIAAHADAHDAEPALPATRAAAAGARVHRSSRP
jgi:hypothetical protein